MLAIFSCVVNRVASCPSVPSSPAAIMSISYDSHPISSKFKCHNFSYFIRRGNKTIGLAAIAWTPAKLNSGDVCLVGAPFETSNQFSGS